MIFRMLLTLSVFVTFHCNANADIFVFTNQADWLAATESVVTEEFSDGTLLPDLSVVSDNGVVALGTWTDTVTDPLIGSSATTTWSYTGAPTAWASEIDLTPGGLGSGLNVDVDFTDATSQSFDTIDASGFWGIVSDDKAISDITFSTTSLLGLGLDQEQYAMDNVSSGFAVSAVPEPGAATLLLLIGVVLVKRRRR
ncbi:hypothetical protein [Mariniblastus fucicola]|uniref:PEP-CTERM protein-sorting domain-containing protein n=1 Tax=Mariniblastus fucicola TaxID=980251 RepID=A0A5B9PLC7_9BACT|nr:hypothetical protein [Mariniblastus fucicola]QEG23481.1 hypothetical protein MFFC18_33800 [Mariniblastus fucicola]